MIRRLCHRTGTARMDRSLAQSLFDRVVLRHPKLVLACLGAAIVFFGWGVRYFRLDAEIFNPAAAFQIRLVDSS